MRACSPFIVFHRHVYIPLLILPPTPPPHDKIHTTSPNQPSPVHCVGRCQVLRVTCCRVCSCLVRRVCVLLPTLEE